LLWWSSYVALGLFTGFFAGMLGIGGGLVMVPALTMMFASQAGFPPTEVLHLALGTAMAAILFTSLASLRAHHQHGAVLWKIVAQITPGILVGTLLGTLFAASIPAARGIENCGTGACSTGMACFMLSPFRHFNWE